MAAIQGVQKQLPVHGQAAVESWIDETAPLGKDASFWRRDAGDVFHELCDLAREKLARVGVRASAEDVFNMFLIVILSFSYNAHVHPQSKRSFRSRLVGAWCGASSRRCAKNTFYMAWVRFPLQAATSARAMYPRKLTWVPADGSMPLLRVATVSAGDQEPTLLPKLLARARGQCLPYVLLPRPELVVTRA